MPDDSNGVYSLPAGTIVSTGDTILPSQHNPWANDNANAMSNRFSKDGRAPATGNWNLNNFRIANLGTPSASTDAANKTYVDAVTTNVSASTRGYLFGLTLSNNASDAVNDIDIAAGAASSDATVPVVMTLSSILTKRLDASWAVGTGNGGLDTGAIANGTYHVWLIQRSDTGVVDALFSASATSPTMPTSYDRKRRIGSIVRISASIKAFSQNGNEFLWKVGILDVTTTTLATTSFLVPLTVPTGIKVNAIINAQGTASATWDVLITSPDQTDSPASASLNSMRGASGTSGYFSSAMRTDTSARIRVVSDVANTTLNVTTQGYVDTRA